MGEVWIARNSVIYPATFGVKGVAFSELQVDQAQTYARNRLDHLRSVKPDVIRRAAAWCIAQSWPNLQSDSARIDATIDRRSRDRPCVIVTKTEFIVCGVI